MPEGDTIHRISRRINAALAGRLLDTATAPNPRSPLHRRASELEAATLTRSEAFGKHLLVHFDDASAWTIADLAAALDAPALIVAAAGLGTLNHTALTLEALRSRRVEPAGLVIGAWPAVPDLAARCNLADQARTGALPLLGALPEGVAGGPDFVAAARAGLAPELGGEFDAADFTRAHAPEPFRPSEAEASE